MVVVSGKSTHAALLSRFRPWLIPDGSSSIVLVFVLVDGGEIASL